MKSTILNILCLAACLSLTYAASHYQRPAMFRSDKLLMDFMVRSSAAQQNSPLRSISCFQYYMPLLNDLAVEYEKDYSACLEACKDSEAKVNEATLSQRNQLYNMATSSCQAVDQCSLMSDAVSSFQCFEDASSNNSKEFYTISTTASEQLLDVREKMRLIQVDEYRCTNASERNYVESSAKTYEDMQNCLTGKIPVPTATTTVSTTVTTEEILSSSESSTSAPTATTTVSTTATTEEILSSSESSSSVSVTTEANLASSSVEDTSTASVPTETSETTDASFPV